MQYVKCRGGTGRMPPEAVFLTVQQGEETVILYLRDSLLITHSQDSVG